MPNHHLLNRLFSHGGREKYPPAALNWVLAVPNLIKEEYCVDAMQEPYEIKDEILDKILNKLANDKPRRDQVTGLLYKMLEKH